MDDNNFTIQLLKMMQPLQEEAQKKAKKAYKTILLGVFVLSLITFILGIFVGWLIF